MVIVNGESTDASGKTVSEYLKSAGYQAARVAVEINLQIIPKVKFEETVLRDGDKVEIVGFVGGG